jgi:hypothetical protein
LQWIAYGCQNWSYVAGCSANGLSAKGVSSGHRQDLVAS